MPRLLAAKEPGLSATEEKSSARFEFPKMLYDMLEEVTDDDSVNKIVSWMPHGYSFKVHKPEQFETDVMPKYFRERYESFRYLLEQWGFHCLRRGKNRGCYWNRFFMRGKRDEIVSVTKEYMLSGMPEYLSPSEEPDFASMEKLDFVRHDVSIIKNKQRKQPPAPSNRQKSGDRKRKRVSELEIEDSSSPNSQAPRSKSLKARRGPARRARSTSWVHEAEDDYDDGGDADSNDNHDDASESASDFEGGEREWQDRRPSSSSLSKRRPTRNRQQEEEAQTASTTIRGKEKPKPSLPTHNSLKAFFKTARNDEKEEATVEAQPITGNNKSSVKKGKVDSLTEMEDSSPNKELSPIPLIPSKPVFSGFLSLPFKKLRLVVMSADEFKGENPFALKRPSAVKKS